MSPTKHRSTVNIDVPATLPIHVRAAIAAARPLLSWAVALGTYRDLYARLRSASGGTFCTRALATLDIEVSVSAGDVLQIPASGPLVIVANHPHGMLDGLTLGSVIERARPDVRILTNHVIAGLPGLSELCLFVDPFKRRGRSIATSAGLRAALGWLADGHALIVFPAGEVAHERAHDGGTPGDSLWHDTALRLAHRMHAPVLPAFIEGRNSERFYRAGRIHPVLRTMLLPRELLAKRGARVTVRVGKVISAHIDSGGADSGAAARRANAARQSLVLAREAVHRLAGRADHMEQEVRALDEASKLIEGFELEVYCARADRIPTVLDEIGRLREVTFRAVGEGTGRATDVDAFDEHYLHLFVWNPRAREVVGAYRLGLVDEIVPRLGIEGLYTSTLFRYDARLLDRLAPAIELGRSFVREEYQRSSNALLLLWKGIARFVARSGTYRVLFGPVSISSRYGDSSQQLLQSFLAQNFYRRDLGELVQALRPPGAPAATRGVNPTLVSGVRDVDALVAKLERDGKGMPVLLRQYLRLNARLLGFNVDPAFGNALDALMMVDLAEVAPAILTRYFGRAEARALLARLLRQTADAA